MPGFLGADDRVVVLAHGAFPDGAKTAVGLLRYADYDVVAVLDRDRAGDRVVDHAPDLPDAPIVAGFEAVSTDADALVIGIAPVGGGFDEAWRPDVEAALRAGCDVVSGLHVALAADDAFARLADRHGAAIHDVRLPPEDLAVARGRAADVDATVVAVVGTDASVGKMTTSMELLEAARKRGVDVGFVPTGQTGIMIAGWGIAIDRVIADFAAGATERMIREIGKDHDILFVEGQGSLGHPAYSADAIGILHGSMADRLVLVHDAAREAVHGWDGFPIPDPGTYATLYESVAAPVRETRVAAGALDTSSLASDAAAREAVEAYGSAIDAPATDVVRFSAAEILEAVVGDHMS